VRRPLAVTALTLALVAGTLAATSAERASAATAAPQQPGQTCILGICFGPSSSPSPSTSATPSPTASSNPLPLPSLPISLPTTGIGSAISGVVGSATATAGGKTVKQAGADPGLVASPATEVLTAGSATMTGFTYVGNTNVALASGGTVTMMKFTADSITLADGVTDTVTQGGVSTVTSSPTLAFSGGVTLYATKLSGSLAGVPLTFTPSTISAVLLTISNLITSGGTITLTSVTTDQPIVIAGQLQTGALTLS
jgi:hypothetical protein